MIVDQWFGIELAPATERSVKLLRKLEVLPDKDFGLVEQIVQRLVESGGARVATDASDEMLRDAFEFGMVSPSQVSP